MLAESPDTAPHTGEPVRGNLSFAYPLEQRARLHLQVLGSLICGKPFGFHISLFSRSGNAGSRRLRGRLCRVLRGETNKVPRHGFSRLPSNLVEDVKGTVSTRLSLLLPTTEQIWTKLLPFITAVRPDSLPSDCELANQGAKVVFSLYELR